VPEVVGHGLVGLAGAVTRRHRQRPVPPARLPGQYMLGRRAGHPVMPVTGLQMPQLVPQDDQLLQLLGPLLDDHQVEVLELHAQAGHFELVGEPLETQPHRASAAPCAHLLAQRPAHLPHTGRRAEPGTDGRGEGGGQRAPRRTLPGPAQHGGDQP
jgi:hypothetical protein